MRFTLLASVLGLAGALDEKATVIAGATGRTGALVYKLLKDQGKPVRALVRNVTKAREVLGCAKCDSAEGIFVGDVTQPATLPALVEGAGSLVIASSASPICEGKPPKCHFPEGGEPVEVDWIGAKELLATFANAIAGRGDPPQSPVVLVSTMGTTQPSGGLADMGHITFYKLNFEAHLMNSGLPFTIVKPCGLDNKNGGEQEILVGHDDDILNLKPPLVSRADVARVVVAALKEPRLSDGLRFDMCAREGSPTTEAGLREVLRSARYPWESKPTAGRAEMVV